MQTRIRQPTPALGSGRENASPHNWSTSAYGQSEARIENSILLQPPQLLHILDVPLLQVIVPRAWSLVTIAMSVITTCAQISEAKIWRSRFDQ